MDHPEPAVRIPAAQDRTLGRAEFVTLRLTIFNSLRTDLPLQRLQEALRDKDHDHWDWLCKSFRSFHNDIVVPHATESSLPLVVLCEPFHQGDEGQDVSSRLRLPHRVVVEFAPEMTMEWEGERITEQFSSNGMPLSVPAHIVDCVTFFESGVIAYSLALMFGRGVDLNAQQLLAIGALVNSAGQLEEGAVTLVVRDGEQPTALPVGSFVQERLNALASGRDIFGGYQTMDRTPFTFLDGWIKSIDRQIANPGPSWANIAELRAHRELALQLRASLHSFRLHAGRTGDKPASDLSPPDQPTNASIGIEVVGAQWHERVLDYAARAGRREARVDDFSLRLAGLAQNVFDFRRQDIEEVNDSLSSTALIGTDITFVQRGVAIRFIEESRAFEEMRSVLGGSPYWLLVQLVLGHNERLLSELNAELEEFRRRYGLHGMIRELLVNTYTAEGKVDDAVERLKRRFVRRMRLAHHIPNIFRYPTEQRHYQLFSQARGLEAQRDYLEKLDTTIEQTLESTAREAVAIGNRSFDVRLQLLLGTIGLLQITGTIASLVAVWPKAGLWACLWEGTCMYTPDGSRALLSIAVIAIGLSLLFGGFVTVRLLRHRVAHWQIPGDAKRPIVQRSHIT